MKKLLLICIAVIFSQLVIAQSITLAPNNPASPTKGTVVFNNTTNLLQYWNGTAWISITNAASATGWAAIGNNISNTNAGNVGIGINIPKAAFNVAAGKTVLFGADSSNGGIKLIWYGSKGALRAGIAHPPRWDYDNVGPYSVALGASTKANGEYSIALGGSTWANGFSSTALGYGSIAYGDYATAIGNSSQANGLNSSALGNGAIANGAGSMALGYATSANNIYSLAMGYQTTATGEYSTAMGSGTIASGSNATAMGTGTIASTDYTTAIGTYNIDVPNSLLTIGKGYKNLGNTTRANALTILNNGYIGIGTTNPLAPLHITDFAFLDVRFGKYFFGAQLGNSLIPIDSPWTDNNVGLLVDKTIVGQFIVASLISTSSDARIKNVIGVSDNQQDLETLRHLKIIDYRYKDVANWGNQNFKKVIAQQVEEVYPQAVRKQTSTIPDIYCLAEKVVYNESKKELNVTLSKNYEVKIGNRMQLIHPEKGKIQAEVIAVSGNSFTVKDWLYPTDKIFVFGREVDDSRVVDYEAISMLGISAIQQLAKENEELVKEIKLLKTSNNQLNARLEAIETLLAKSQSGK